MKTLHERGIELERRLEGEDRRTVHQLGLMHTSFLEVADVMDKCEEILEIVETDEDEEEA
jgi:hypothetical protein